MSSRGLRDLVLNRANVQHIVAANECISVLVLKLAINVLLQKRKRGHERKDDGQNTSSRMQALAVKFNLISSSLL